MPRLTEAQREEIRAAYIGKHGQQRELAAKYGVSQPAISQIVGGQKVARRAFRKKQSAETEERNLGALELENDAIGTIEDSNGNIILDN